MASRQHLYAEDLGSSSTTSTSPQLKVEIAWTARRQHRLLGLCLGVVQQLVLDRQPPRHRRALRRHPRRLARPTGEPDERADEPNRLVSVRHHRQAELRLQPGVAEPADHLLLEQLRRHDQDTRRPAVHHQGRRRRPVRRDAVADQLHVEHAATKVRPDVHAGVDRRLSGDRLRRAGRRRQRPGHRRPAGASRPPRPTYAARSMYCKDDFDNLAVLRRHQEDVAERLATFILQYNSITNGQTNYIQNARILALRLDTFNNNYSAQTLPRQPDRHHQPDQLSGRAGHR